MLETGPIKNTHEGKTFQYQSKLSKLPIPDLQGTIDRYLAALKPLQVRNRILISWINVAHSLSLLDG